MPGIIAPPFASRLRRALPLAMVIAIAAAAPVLAQTTAAPRGRTAAANGRAPRDSGQTLDMTLALTAIRDSDVPLEARSLVNTGDPASTSDSTMLVGTTGYSWRSRHLQMRATGSSALRHDRLSGDVQSVSHTGAAGLTATIPLVTVFLNQTAAYSPSYLFGLFPQGATPTAGDAPVAAPDYATTDLGSYSYATQLRLTTTPTRRTTFSVDGDRSRTDYQNETGGQPDLDSYAVSGDLAMRIGRASSINGRYRYRVGTFATGTGTILSGDTTEHSLELGFAQARRLSRTRQLTVNVSAGSGVMLVPPTLVAESGEPQPWRLQGQAAVTFAFAQGWETTFNYRRGVEYVPGLLEPVASKGATAGVTGLLTRRLDVLVSAAYSSGEGAISQNAATFDTYTGDARLRYAVTSTLSAYVEYLYYFYDFGGGVSLVPGIPRGLERNGLRAGVTWRLSPLGRVTRAARP